MQEEKIFQNEIINLPQMTQTPSNIIEEQKNKNLEKNNPNEIIMVEEKRKEEETEMEIENTDKIIYQDGKGF